MALRIKNWDRFQHFKEKSLVRRNVIWIKLYCDLLNNPDWHTLEPMAAKVLVMLWLLAAERDGYLPDINVISFRLRVDIKTLTSILQTQLNQWLEGDDINLISNGYQNDIAEENREEKNREEKTRIRATAASAADTEIPENLKTEKFMAAWEDWKRHRKEKRSALTPSTTKTQLAKFAKFGPAISVLAIEQAIEKGWTGVFPEKIDPPDSTYTRDDEPKPTWQGAREIQI